MKILFISPILFLSFSFDVCAQRATSKEVLVKNNFGKEVKGTHYEYVSQTGNLLIMNESFPFSCSGKTKTIVSKSESYFDNGALKSKGYLEGNGTQISIEEYYNENGDIEKKMIYEDFCEFSWKEIVYDAGKPIKTITIIDGSMKNVQIGDEDYKPKVVVKGAVKSTTQSQTPKNEEYYSKNSSQSSGDEGNKYCFDDSYNSGNKFELLLIDGGKAKIVIKSSDDRIIRTGEGTWSGSNDGPGGNAPLITLKLTTGVLKFTAIVDGISPSINMLIDSRNNQWIKCW